MNEADTFFSEVIGPDWKSSTPVPVTGEQLVSALWSLNDVFKPKLARIESVRYDAAYESEADDAVIAFIERGPSAWESCSPGCWRVLMERHKQLITVAMLNDAAGNPVTFIPDRLPKKHLQHTVMLLLLLRMKLPLPLTEEPENQLPGHVQPGTMRQH